MEAATTTTEAHLSAIHQSLLQISATLGRMLTYGCVNATSSPDAVVPAKCSTVGLNPNIGAVEVVDSSQQSGIVSTVNPGLVGAPPSSTMQRFGILKSGKHTPTTCSTGVLDVDTDAKNAKRDAGTLQAGLSVHVPWDPGVCNDAYSICQEKTGSHLQGVRGCVLYVWALANQLKELQLPLQCIPIEIDQPCSLVIWSITISWDPGILQQIVRQASRPRKLDVQGVMFLHTIMLQQKLGDWSEFMDAVEANFHQEHEVQLLSSETPVVGAAHPDFDGISNKSGSIEGDPGGVHMLVDDMRVWDSEPPSDSQLHDTYEQIMDPHQELEGETDKSICLDHGVGGVQVLPRVVPSVQGKLQQLLVHKEACMPCEFLSLIHLSSQLQYKQWDPSVWRFSLSKCYNLVRQRQGTVWLGGGTAATWKDLHVIRARFPQALAWGQASSPAGADVTPAGVHACGG